MAWTNPKTWSFGEVLSSTDMNTYVRDNTLDLDARVDAAAVIKQVVSTVKTDTFSASIDYGASAAVTGLTVSITPTSLSSKILVFVHPTVSGADTQGTFITLTRGGSAVVRGNAADTRQRVTTGTYTGQGSGNYAVASTPFAYLDSPSTTSPVTYGIDLSHSRATTQTLHLNRGQGDDDDIGVGRGASTITAIEVAA